MLAAWARRCIAALFVAAAAAGPVQAQSGAASLLADTITASDGVVTASGNVEVFFENARLTASRIIYDSAANRLVIEGPLVLTDGQSTVFLADSAELGAELREGILRGARMVLNDQLQIAAAEINRVDGRYTQLYKSVASSCKVCAANPVPLWQIRAEKIVHDQQARQLYFTNAQFLVAGVPVFYLPRLRMPDPTLDRAPGFLRPVLRNSSRLGVGLKVPYFQPLGDHADLTLTPFLATRTRTIEGRYRQAFGSGRIELNGAVSQDDLRMGTRAYLTAEGTFDLPRGFRLGFDATTVSDPAYLQEYGYSGADRLNSSVQITRTRGLEQIDADLTHVRTLRGRELPIADEMPSLLGSASYQRRFFPAALGGQGIWEVNLDSHYRMSTADADGRDVTRVGGRVDWDRSHTFANGMVGRVGLGLALNLYRIDDDAAAGPYAAFVAPQAEVELRWPLARDGRDGARQVLEPMLHLGWADTFGDTVPNEDSIFAEFDEGNMMAVSRMPGDDAVEQGLHATAALRWTRYDADGWSASATLGRIIRVDDNSQFGRASGLNGQLSDWLVAGQLATGSGLSLTARALLGDDLSATKAETRIDWTSERLNLGSVYSWIVPDPSEGRTVAISQLGFDAGYWFTQNWRGSTELSYDFGRDRPARAGVGVVYRNDCASVDLSLSRRFTSSTNVKPDTDINIAISLFGFGSGAPAGKASCAQFEAG